MSAHMGLVVKSMQLDSLLRWASCRRMASRPSLSRYRFLAERPKPTLRRIGMWVVVDSVERCWGVIESRVGILCSKMPVCRLREERLRAGKTSDV
jgi:hypothetical protein